MWLSTFAFALALAANVAVVASWITCSRRTRALSRAQSTTVSNFRALSASVASELTKMRELQRELERSTPAKLAAEVAALGEAVDKLTDTHRRFAGRFHARLGASTPQSQTVTPDDEVAQFLALQSAPSAQPQ